MKKNVQNIIKGTVFVMALALTTTFALLDRNISTSVPYQAVFENADGITRNTPVYMAGVQVGSVSDIALKNGRVNLTLQVDKDIKIPQDSMLKVETLDLFATKTLHIAPGFEEDTLASNAYFESVQNSIDILGLLHSYLDSRIETAKKKKVQ